MTRVLFDKQHVTAGETSGSSIPSRPPPSLVTLPHLKHNALLPTNRNVICEYTRQLFAMGLGAGSIPLAATLNWVIKDGLGQLGGIAFSGLVNTRFDANPKLW